MAYRYPSAEWTAALHEQINQSDAYAQSAKTWEGDILFVTEGAGAIHLDLWHGTCRASSYVENPASVKAEYRITAPPEKWKSVLTGKLDPIQGMVTRQLKLEGNLVKIMKNVKAAQELVKCATKVDTAWE